MTITSFLLKPLTIGYIFIGVLIIGSVFLKSCSHRKQEQKIFQEQKKKNIAFLQTRVEQSQEDSKDIVELQRELNHKNEEKRQETIRFLKSFQ